MKVLILAAGGHNVGVSDDAYPLILTEFDGIPLIEKMLSRCKAIPGAEIVVALPENEIHSFHLEEVVKLLDPAVEVLKVENPTKGAACTALLAVEHIDREEELLIINGNELLDIDFASAVGRFRAGNWDAGTVTFPSVHPRYSYVRTDEGGFVTEAAEKLPISRTATAGFYWFKSGAKFVDSTENMIRKDAHVDGLFYICPVLNEFILRGDVVGSHPTSASSYHPLKTGRQVQMYEATNTGKIYTV